MEKKIILLLSMARCGTNYLTSLMHRFKNINANAEIFHKHNIHCNTEILTKLKQNLNDKELRDLIDNDPLNYIRKIKDVVDEDYIFFKMFDSHFYRVINDDNIKNFLKEISLVLIVDRNPLDIFISKKKADKIKKWSQVDTSSVKIDFEIKEYESFLNRKQTWFDKIDKMIHESNIPTLKLNYETISEKSDSDNIKYFANEFSNNKMNLSFYSLPVDNVKHFKQDKSKNLCEKIENYDSIKKYFHGNEFKDDDKFISKIKFTKSNLWKHHYFGWSGAVNNLSKLNSVLNPILFEPAIESTFINKQTRCEDTINKYKHNKWVGTFHNPYDDPRNYFNINDVLRKPERKKDLMKCWENLCGVVVFSNEVKENYIKYSEFKDKPIYVAKHPTCEPTEKFNYDNFFNSKTKKLIYAGGHLRDNKLNSFIIENIKTDLTLVNLNQKPVSNDHYDRLLSDSLVFVKYEKIVASNLLVECIVRNTPIFVNKLNAVVEYLGEDYPLYYDTQDELISKINNLSKIKMAHEYLKRISNDDFNMTGFKNELFNSKFYGDLKC
jgi:hypothetical protein